MRNRIYASILFLILSGTGLTSGFVETDSVRIPVRGFGFYKAEVSATDSYGNSSVIKDPGIFVVH